MELVWKASPADARKLRAFIKATEADPFVRNRKRHNLGSKRRVVSKPAFWHALVGCLLTSQQRSGPTSAVARFMRQRPFPLAYPLEGSPARIEGRVTRTLTEFGGIRMSTRIGKQLAGNFTTLEAGLWPVLLTRLDSLTRSSTPEDERALADYLDDTFAGIGPKQSRNLLQSLGLSRYEIPIDSRITKWLNAFGFPFHLTADGLADRHYFAVVSKGIQSLCAAAGVLPCVFDAAVFASYDNGGWTESNSGDWGYDGA